MRRKLIQSAFVNLSWAVIAAIDGVRLIRTLVTLEDTAVRLLQLALLVTQAFCVTRTALRSAKSAFTLTRDEELSLGVSPLSLVCQGACFIRGELLRALFQATLSWWPLPPASLGSAACFPPQVNILQLQALHTALATILGASQRDTLLTLPVLPLYLLLDWRYASLNALPAGSSLLAYTTSRGGALLLTKLFFSGVPALIRAESPQLQCLAAYGVCLPLLAAQAVVSGFRISHGINQADPMEVWVTVVAVLGTCVGPNVGQVLADLREQCQRAMRIADDVFPHHVVDSLMLQRDDAAEPAASPLASCDSSFSTLAPPLHAPAAAAAATNAAASMPTQAPPPPHCRSAPLSRLQTPQKGVFQASVSAAAPAVEPASVTSLRQLSIPLRLLHTGRPSMDRPCTGRPSVDRPPTAHQAGGRLGQAWDSVPLPMSPCAPSITRRTSFHREVRHEEAAEYAEEHPRACVLFADVVSFTSMSEGRPASVIVNMLNTLYCKLDDIVSRVPNLYKVDVIGDCYMVATGLRWHNDDPCPARTIVNFAKLMIETAATVRDPSTNAPLQMRCGIHQGPVVGALLGGLRRKYSLFSSTVNSASRLESTSKAGTIHVSAAIYNELVHQDTDTTLMVVANRRRRTGPGLETAESAAVAHTADQDLLLELEGKLKLMKNGMGSMDSSSSGCISDGLEWTDKSLRPPRVPMPGSELMRFGEVHERDLADSGCAEDDGMDCDGATAAAVAAAVQASRSQVCRERWQWCGQVVMKGCAPMETYMLQVM